MKRKLAITAGSVVAILVLGFGWALAEQRVAVEFYSGHTHTERGITIGTPEHGGGTDRYGCHNGSVPYHCH